MLGSSWRNKAAVVFALLASPLAIYVGYTEQAQITRTMAEGDEYPAVIERVQRHRSRRGNVTYDVWVKWTDGYGVAQKDYTSVSEAFGENAAVGQAISVRVAPGERKFVIVQDAKSKASEWWWMVWVGVAVGAIGVGFAPGAFKRQRRTG